ncbi:MAG: FecR domain-containing protein [Treponema sp.]|jgi:hypothetical protein|nr:FecR domain-containing protein [Treponema sp.]
MKKIIMIFLTLITAAGAFCQNGVIRELTGNVELKHSGASVFVPANAGDTIESSTIVSTGFRSFAIIEVGNSVITVHPLTRLSLAEIQTRGNTENVNVNLQAGRVSVDVNPPAGARASFRVQSPASVASVRGTSFEMDTETLTVSEGRVIYNGTAGTAAIVTGGNSSYIDIDGTPANPVEVAEVSFAPASPIGALSSETTEVTITTGYGGN